MNRILCTAALCLLIGASPAHAAGIRYLEDPVYTKIAPEDEWPMQDLMTLAAEGDARAQFILGDLYSKGKGGLAKNRVKAHYWFEISARHGFTPAFFRLGALAKHNHDYIEACQWYALDADHSDGKERDWSRGQVQVLQKSLSKNAFATAKKGERDWLDRQREAMTVILKDEETARKTLPPPDLGDDDDKDTDKGKDKDAKKDKAGDTDKPVVKDTNTARKEFHYNE